MKLPALIVLAMMLGCGDDAPSGSADAAGAGAGSHASAAGAGGVAAREAHAGAGGQASKGQGGSSGGAGAGGQASKGQGGSSGGAGAGAGGQASKGQGGSSGASGVMASQSAGSQPSAAGQAAMLDVPPHVSNTVVSVAFGQAAAGNPTPLVLFEGGYATWDETILAKQPLDVAASMQATPKMWEQWRRGAKNVEIKSGQGWKPLPSDDEYAPTTKGTRLSALYERVFSPDPSAEVLVVLVWRYRFRSDGTFEYCYTATIAGDPPAFSKERKARKGSYEIDGYVAHFDDDAGLKDTESFIYDSARSHWLWVDDQPLELTKDTGQAVCD